MEQLLQLLKSVVLSVLPPREKIRDNKEYQWTLKGETMPNVTQTMHMGNRHFSLLNVNAAGACGYDFPCDGGRLVRAYLRRRRGTI